MSQVRHLCSTFFQKHQNQMKTKNKEGITTDGRAILLNENCFRVPERARVGVRQF